MLLCGLLKSIDPKSYPLIQSNISDVISSIEGNRANLIKDIAQKKLYEILYSTVENDPPNPENLALHKAIGKALARAIEEDRENRRNDPNIVALREKLTKEIIAALTPQPPTP
jgi:hypothetical protein